MQLKIWLSRFQQFDGAAKPSGKSSAFTASSRRAVMEFHIRRDIREEFSLEHQLFSLRGNVFLADIRQARDLAQRFNAKANHPDRYIRAGQLNVMGLIDEMLHYLVALYREQVQPDLFSTALDRLESRLGPDRIAALLEAFGEQFPPQQVYAGNITFRDYLASSEGGESCRSLALEELLLLAIANLNPAFAPFSFLFDDSDLERNTLYNESIAELRSFLSELPPFGPDGLNLWDLLRAPALASPDSLTGQLEFMRRHWGLLLSGYMARLLIGVDVIREEEKPVFFGPGPSRPLRYDELDEYERFSPDQDWMPRTVLIAKSALVWLYQLSQTYNRQISRLDEIPDEALDELAQRGFTGLWLIGLWERSDASRTIKRWAGNPEAAASAYSLHDYDIAEELGSWPALHNLRERCFQRGIRLGSDMLPNHTGIDSTWVLDHPNRFLQLSYPPFPSYTFTGGNLSGREDIGIFIEDHYYTRDDAAVVFKREDYKTRDIRFIYHGNDGTSMPWNDTAQIDFLNAEAREAVIQTIIGVCKQFSIVRFDAAMTLAKRHIQRLWYPEPGQGGDIASRAEQAISSEEFHRRIPNEFWREVVDRCAVEAPNTLLLAEAFWMMEGYFVRTLGMHRVYNSAFMNMLKNEENAKYRATIKNTLEFDPEILKRFVNFMNNPDEETAVAQFGKGDKYFGICTLLVTMPGLPMFGHAQIEGFEEKYGMEYRRSYWDEAPDPDLVERHEREIFPLMKQRRLFSGSESFRLFDVCNAQDGEVNENVFAYTNQSRGDRVLVLYNNAYPQVEGWIQASSVEIPQKDGGIRRDTLTEALFIQGESSRFTLFREQRSGLWYIRSSKELVERGLFVSLRGYEAQVFLDIHEVADEEDGATRWSTRWAVLNHELHGQGVADIHKTMMNIFLGELYAPLMDMLSPNRMEAIHQLLGAMGDASEAAPLAEILRDPVLAFIYAAQDYLYGAGGNYLPFAHSGEYAPMDPGAICDEFLQKLGHLAYLAFYSHQGTYRAGTAERFLADYGKRVEEDPLLCAVCIAYMAVAMLPRIVGNGCPGALGVALADHWNLGAKIQEAFELLGMPPEEAPGIIELAKAVAARTMPERIALYKADLPRSIIAENYEAEDFRRILRINTFDDVTWFNKEAYKDTLAYAPFFLTLEGDAAFKAAGGVEQGMPRDAAFRREEWLKRVRIIANATGKFVKAEAKSGYRLDLLMEAVASPARKARKGL